MMTHYQSHRHQANEPHYHLLKMMLVVVILQAYLLSISAAFVSPSPPTKRSSSDTRAFFDDWESISPERGVWKQIITEGSGNVPDKESTLEISYKGVLFGEDWWTPQDVVDCWMSELQGMDEYCAAITAENVDGPQLLDPELFTENFVKEKLGVSGKIQCKKLVMAAKRLQKVREDFPLKSEFDSNAKFIIEPTKRIIRGIRLGVESMKVGDEAKVVCRADYGYGGEGLRRNNGDIMVPPFATLCFEISLLNASDS